MYYFCIRNRTETVIVRTVEVDSAEVSMAESHNFNCWQKAKHN